MKRLIFQWGGGNNSRMEKTRVIRTLMVLTMNVNDEPSGLQEKI
jgi:hypothetical protein